MRPLALTMGEPAGIGAEITIKAWAQRHGRNLPAFVALDDPDRLRAEADRLNCRMPIKILDTLDDAEDIFETALPVFPVYLKEPNEDGKLNLANTRSVLDSIDTAVRLTLEGQCSGIVTNPIHKNILYEAGFNYPGHTEYLAKLCVCDHDPVMMLTAQDLRVVPLTIHVPLKDVPGLITAELIQDKIKRTVAALQDDFGIDDPRVVVTGLNPHAGEEGSFGDEEQTVITPAIKDLQTQGYNIRGPLAADSMFHEDAREEYDVAVCMYHDQALIPLKTLDFHNGVNVTLGLRIIRTSPDHGCALNIAGKGIARPDSLAAAIALAGQLAKNKANAARV